MGSVDGDGEGRALGWSGGRHSGRSHWAAGEQGAAAAVAVLLAVAVDVQTQVCQSREFGAA